MVSLPNKCCWMKRWDNWKERHNEGETGRGLGTRNATDGGNELLLSLFLLSRLEWKIKFLNTLIKRSNSTVPFSWYISAVESGAGLFSRLPTTHTQLVHRHCFCCQSHPYIRRIRDKISSARMTHCGSWQQAICVLPGWANAWLAFRTDKQFITACWILYMIVLYMNRAHDPRKGIQLFFVGWTLKDHRKTSRKSLACSWRFITRTRPIGPL